MNRNAPIGVFDSGVGGLTVARAIRDSLPHESLIYIGDTAHSPYGTKSIADVRNYSLAVLDELVEQGVKMLVIACNTASAAMLKAAEQLAKSASKTKAASDTPPDDPKSPDLPAS